MTSRGESTVVPTVADHPAAPARWQDRFRTRTGEYVAYLGFLTLLFIQPLASLMAHAAVSDLHSHIVLVPFISGYLFFIRRKQFPTAHTTSYLGAAAAGAVVIAALAARFGLRENLSLNDGLALMAVAFVSSIVAGGFLFLGSKWIVAASFPLAFLIFLAPLPDSWVNSLEYSSAHASADATATYFDVTATPYVRHGQVFELPGIAIEVAKECSGIRSSLVLFISSLLASHLFLRARWAKILLVAFVIPLGILRNGFRILVIGLLCIHVGPHMIDSPIHHQGGPLFFALSLIPFGFLLWWLRRRERRHTLPV
jgi:exosortase C (VPDSG-CTERM-specific)